MKLHKHSANWKLGLILAVAATVSWAAQPIGLSILVKSVSPIALAFYKLVSSALVLTIFLSLRKQIPNFPITKTAKVLLIVASLALGMSYVLFAKAFIYISPANAQLYLQSSRIFLVLCGVLIFKEFFNKTQWVALVGLAIGFILFFHNQAGQVANNNQYEFGVILVICSSALWAIYAILQKQLLAFLSSQQILLFIYIASSIAILPFVDFRQMQSIGEFEWWTLALVCLSNILAFGFFSEALNHWEASRISAVTCFTPLLTVCFTFFVDKLSLPTFAISENLDLVALMGSILIAFCAAAVSIAGNTRSTL